MNRLIKLGVAGALAAVVLMIPTAMFAQGAPDLSQFGYPSVIASATIQPGQGATVGGGQIQAVVPTNAFTDPVKFEILQGSNSTFQPLVASNLTVVVNFAFRVTDLKTGLIVGKFGAPVVAVITDPNINARSQYMDTTPTASPAVAANPVAPIISGDVLKHGNLGAPVGWIVVSPTSSLPSTGGSPLPPASAPIGLGVLAAVLLLGAVAALTIRRRASAR